MKKKYVILLTVLVLVSFFCITIYKSNWHSKESEVVKIGVILPLSGKSAILGEPKKRAFDIALDEFNSTQKRLEIVYEDSQGDATAGTSAFNKLLLDKSIDCYYIDLTPIVNACVPIVNTKKVITFAGSAEPEVTDLSHYLFRLFAGGDQEIRLMVDYLRQHSIQKVFVLHTNELYGTNAYKYFQRMYVEMGGTIVGKDEYPMNNGDFKAQLTKIKASSADKVILLGYGNEYPALLRQSIEYDLLPDKYICNLGGSNKSVMELPSKLTEGMTFIGPRFSYLLGKDSLNAEMRSFVTTYRLKYKENPDFRAAYAYDMVKIFMGVNGNGGKSIESIINDLLSIKNYKGASGSISFKDNGDTETDLICARYENGTIKMISQ